MGQFLLPCESGEKITLGLTVLLAYSVFSFNIAENMPETSEVIPLIGKFFLSFLQMIHLLSNKNPNILLTLQRST